jgi:hypothetical protein
MVQPLGFADSVGARDANRMLCRVMLLMQLAISAGLVAVLEQPVSSVMQHHSRFQALLGSTMIFRSEHLLGQFGGESRKPVMLFSNVPIWHRVNEFIIRDWVPASHGLVYRPHTDVHGFRRTTGLRGLKSTQAYPRAFGRAVAAVYHAHRGVFAQPTGQHAVPLIDLRRIAQFASTDTWEDAGLHEVLQLLRELVCNSSGWL